METLKDIIIDWGTRVGVDLTYSIFGNTLYDYILALVALVVFVAAFKLLQWVILLRLAKLAKKTETDIDDTFIEIVRSLRPPFYYFLAFYLALQSLSLSAFLGNIVKGILIIWLVYQVIIAFQILIAYVLSKRFKQDSDPGTQAALGYLQIIAKVALWSMGILLVLSNFGVNVTSLIAGLGIGGIAIAFALQNILGDLFSSFAIYFDKPFQIGDFIVVGEHAGTVEKIGIKSTRIRASTGEELIISNRELTTTRIKNFRKIAERRSVFTLGVLYETPVSKLREIPKLIEGIITSKQKTRFDRVHLRSFGDSSLNFEVSFYVQSTDFAESLDVGQEINLEIIETFEKQGIGFAYPTQTVYVTK